MKKFKQHSINIKNYTAHPHDLVHVPAKFRENTALRFWVTVRKLNVTDRRTDGQTDRRGALQYLPSRAFGAAGDKKSKYILPRNIPDFEKNPNIGCRKRNQVVFEKLIF